MKWLDAIKPLSLRWEGENYREAVSMAILALESMPEYEKLKERDRVMVVKEVYQDEYYCPACGTEIFYIGEKETHKFCLECGQRIDWSEEEEHEN